MSNEELQITFVIKGSCYVVEMAFLEQRKLVPTISKYTVNSFRIFVSGSGKTSLQGGNAVYINSISLKLSQTM